MTPTSFLARAGEVYGNRVATVEDGAVHTYAELLERSKRLAGALVELGVTPGDRVSILAPNCGAVLEAHFGVPWAGAVINTLNTRLSSAELAYIIDHVGSVVLLVDAELLELATAALDLVPTPPSVVVIGGAGPTDYEQIVTGAPPVAHAVENEYGLLAINYTSGTTGKPKGVQYSHRGAYLQALAMVHHVRLDTSSRYLWTLPMFHCNGWCFPWAVTAAGGRHVIIRRPEPSLVWNAIESNGVTHFSGAPTVLTRLAAEPVPPSVDVSAPISVSTGGAPPSPSLLARLGTLNFDVTHLYGLTETYGPAAICDWLPEWDGESTAVKAALRARQGVGNVVGEPIRVWVEDQGEVPHDGTTVGEVQLRGNNVMLGYYKDDDATAAANCEGWFRTGDLGVVHPDGYIELRDRSKDVIISGGENITSIEVEQAIDSHPAVLESAVVGIPDEEWGQVVAAIITVRDGMTLAEAEIVDHVRSRIARFKAPRRIVFGDLVKTGTGKVQKFRMREQLSLLAAADAPVGAHSIADDQ
ncbi:AMP-binding protein [Actinomycetes bacterium M1A6_2h]